MGPSNNNRNFFPSTLKYNPEIKRRKIFELRTQTQKNFVAQIKEKF